MNTYEEMNAWLSAKKAEEAARGELTFLGIPDRWFEGQPLFRCENGHVSKGVLKTETQGDRCLACQGRCRMTFPEDNENILIMPIDLEPDEEATSSNNAV
jgi:hypothetical protein